MTILNLKKCKYIRKLSESLQKNRSVGPGHGMRLLASTQTASIRADGIAERPVAYAYFSSLQRYPAKFTSYSEASFCVVCLLTKIPNPCYCNKRLIICVISYVEMVRENLTFKRMFMCDTHVKKQGEYSGINFRTLQFQTGK
jgi:hypothetical protein